MPVKPLAGFVEWRYSMRFALANANHRDDQKNKRRQLEQCPAQRAVSDRADHTEQRMNDQNGDVESKGLRRMKANLHLFAWDKKQFE